MFFIKKSKFNKVESENTKRPVIKTGFSLNMLSITLILISLLAVGILSGCDSKDDRQSYINVFNWGEFIDPDLIAEFEKESGLTVNYNTVATCEEMYAKIKSGGVAYDIVVPSDYMISRMIEENMLLKIDKKNVPNEALVDETFRNPVYDPTGEYSIPYQFGTIGIIYNADVVDEQDIGSWDLLWNKKYKKQILMFDNSRDALGIALKRMGYSYNTTDESVIRRAAEMLKEQKPLVQAYVMDQIFDKMENGEAAIAPYYTGDYFLMLKELGENSDMNLKFYIPKEGSNLFVDSMCIPADAGNKAGAEAFINFICKSENMAKNTEWIYYSTAESSARALLPKELRDNDEMYPEGEELKRFETYLNLPKNARTLYDALWVQVMSS